MDYSVNSTITITINGNDVSNELISYVRDKNICTGIGTVDVNLRYTGTMYDPWDEVIITEDGIQKGIFYVAVTSRNSNTGILTLACQDNSKKLNDYFIDESYTIDYYSTTREWLEQFLTEAGVSYSINSPDIIPLSENTSLGFSSAYDTVLQLCQYTGWYFYFDGNGVCQIGSLTCLTNGLTRLTDDEILSLKINRHDTSLRNRAVVWGNADPITSGWVYSDISTITPWNYDANDLRAVVYTNSNIESVSAAEEIARKILNTFSILGNEKEVSLTEVYGFDLGDFVYLDSRYYTGSCMITSINVSISDKGMITSLILDEKCPRLFSYWNNFDDYVYIGTTTSGVWRKPLDGSLWEDFSTGLSGSRWITDLYVNNDNFVCTTASGEAYYRTIYNPWQLLMPSGVIDVQISGEYTYADLYANACTINHLSNDIIVGYSKYDQTYDAGFVISFSGANQFSCYQAYVGSGADANYNITLIDLDTNDKNNVISTSQTIVVTSGILGVLYDGGYGDTDYPAATLSRYSLGYLDENYISFDSLSAAVGRYYFDFDTIISYTDGYSTYKKLSIFDFTLGEYRSFTYELPGRLSIIKDKEKAGYCYAISVEGVANVPVAGKTTYWIYVYNINILTGDSVLVNYKTSVQDYSLGNSYQLVCKDNLFVVIHNIPASFEGDMFGIYGSVLGADVESYYVDQYSTYIDYHIDESYLYMFEDDIDTSNGTYYVIAHIFNFEAATYSTQTETLERPNSANYDWFSRRGRKPVLLSKAGIGKDQLQGQISNIFDCHKLVPNTYPEDYVVIYVQMANGVMTVENLLRQDSQEISAEDKEALDSTTIKYALAERITNFYCLGWDDDLSASEYKIYDPTTIRDYVGTGYFRDILSPIDNIVLPNSNFYYQSFSETTDKLFWIVDYTTEPWQLKRLSPLTGGTLESYDIPALPIFVGEEPYLFAYASNVIIITTTHDTYLFSSRPEAAFYNILHENKENFDWVFSTIDAYNVEISKQTPTEIWNYTDGTLNLPVYQSFSNLYGSFSGISVDYPSYDLRTCNFISISGIILSSGIMTNTNGQYVLIATTSGINGFPTTSGMDGSIQYATFSGITTHIETSNHLPVQYVFASVSGASQIFYQQGPYSAGSFIDYSATLPSSDITIIRLDDRI